MNNYKIMAEEVILKKLFTYFFCLIYCILLTRTYHLPILGHLLDNDFFVVGENALKSI